MKIGKSYIITLTGVIIGTLLVFALFDHNPRYYAVSYQRTPELGEVAVISVPSNASKEEVISGFVIEPNLEGQFYWREEGRNLYFIPDEGFSPGRQYVIKVGKGRSQFLASFVGRKEHVFESRELPKKVLVRTPEDPTIYYITEGGLKRPFFSIEIFHSYPANKLEDVQIISEEILELYPDNTLIHLDHDPRVYKLEGDQKRLIKNIDTFMALGLDRSVVAPINLAQFNSYPTGESLNVIVPPDEIFDKNKAIEINLDKMKANLWQDGEIIKTYTVAGKGNPWASPTREGLFEVKTKEDNHFSGLSHVWMPWSMQYSGNYFIHEWPYWPGGTPITSKYSGGCVRLHKGDAKEVFDWAEVGTAVLIH